MSWERPFDAPLLLPNGATARSLREAANYVKRLPQSERDRQEWRLAIHLLIEAAEDCGPLTFARLGMLNAMDREAETRFEPEPQQVNVTSVRRRKPMRHR